MEENICAKIDISPFLEPEDNLPCDSWREASTVIGLGSVDGVRAGGTELNIDRTLIGE
jgi:hypothetical protein